MKNRIIAMVLAATILFGPVSCRKKEDETKTPDTNIVIQTEKIEYSDEFVANTAGQITSLITDLAESFGYSEYITDNDKAYIENSFKNDIVPILIDIGIYPEELTSLISYVREADIIKDQNLDMKSVSNLYTKLMSLLENDRFGALSYEMHLLTITNKLNETKKNYDKLGYAYYLEDIEYYNTLIEKAEKLGREKFTDAISILVFTCSSFNGAIGFSESGISISIGDVLAIMEKQSVEFASISLSEEDWQTVAEMCETFLPKTGNTNLVALRNDHIFLEVADVMPELVNFYVKLTSDISKNNTALTSDGTPYAYERAICNQLAANESEFLILLSKLEEKFPRVSANTITAAKISDRAGYESFCAEYSATSDELMDAVKTFAEEPSYENYETLGDACLGYLAYLNSAVAYLWIYT